MVIQNMKHIGVLALHSVYLNFAHLNFNAIHFSLLLQWCEITKILSYSPVVVCTAADMAWMINWNR